MDLRGGLCRKWHGTLVITMVTTPRSKTNNVGLSLHLVPVGRIRISWASCEWDSHWNPILRELPFQRCQLFQQIINTRNRWILFRHTTLHQFVGDDHESFGIRIGKKGSRIAFTIRHGLRRDDDAMRTRLPFIIRPAGHEGTRIDNGSHRFRLAR
jgi:hypothetical protein